MLRTDIFGAPLTTTVELLLDTKWEEFSKANFWLPCPSMEVNDATEM